MKRKKDSKFHLIVILLIVCVTAVITVLNIQIIFNVTSRQTEELGSLQMDGIRAQLQQTLDEAKQENLKISADVDLFLQQGKGTDELDPYFRKMKEKLESTSLINVYAASTDWYVIPDFQEPEDFDATQRGWYLGAVEADGEVYITQPYMDLASDYVCFTVSKLLSDGKTVVAIDYNLLGVQEYISEMSEGGRTALIVTEDGQIVGYTEENLLGQDLSEALPEYEEILELEKNNANQVVLTQNINGVRQNVFCSKTENNWYLILCVNSSELYRDSYKQFAWLTIVNAALMVAIILLYLHTVKNREKAEEALRARDEFLNGMSSNLKQPIASILNHSNPESETTSRESIAQVRESALKLSDMVDNLLSYSGIIITEKEEKQKKRTGSMNGVNKRVRLAIIAVISVAMVISILLFSVSNLRLGNQQIREEANHYEDELSQWITEQKSILSMFCNMITANPEILDNYDECVSYLDSITENYEDISVVYMTNPEAEHTVIMNNGWQPEPDWHVEERQWYIETEKSEDGFNISTPYFDEQTGYYCVTFSQIVYDAEGNRLGIFGIDFYMDKLIEILGESYTDTSYAFLVDAEGNIINHPNAYYQMTQNGSSNVLDVEYKTAYSNVGTITQFKDYDGDRKACVSEKNEASDFTVIVVKNWWSIYGTIILFCVLFVIMFGVCIFAVYYLISRVMKWQESVNDELQEAVQAATAAGNAKSQFLAQMSHEIRTPINAVLGMNEMIIRETTDNQIKDYAADIQSAGRTLLSLINSILDFSKIEDGKMEIVNVEYDTVSMINELVNMIAERAAKKHLEMKYDIDETLPATLLGDDIRIRQIILNLLTNAVKYTEKGTVTLKLSGTRGENGTVSLSVAVTDTGIGIKEEDKNKLCQSFSRLDQERNHNIEGTGLGLSIVSKLLAMMGSELKVDSVYGEGSTFYFSLQQTIISDTPIGDFSARHSQAAASIRESRFLYAPEAEILVVDDNEMNLKVVRNLLKRNGIVPDTAGGGAEALEKAEKKKYDVIFLDHMMPGMDGFETLACMRERGLVTESDTVIALTANAINGAREQYLAAGFSDYLSKPIDVNKLEQKLVKYLPENKISYKTEEEPPVSDTGAAVSEDAGSKPEPVSEQAPKKIDYRLGLSYCAGEPDIYKEAAQAYLEEGDSNMEKLDSCYEKKDWKNYAIVAHAIKSTSLTLGAKELSELAKEHEFAGKENREADIDASYFTLLEQYQAVLIELKEMLKEL